VTHAETLPAECHKPWELDIKARLEKQHFSKANFSGKSEFSRHHGEGRLSAYSVEKLGFKTSDSAALILI